MWNGWMGEVCGTCHDLCLSALPSGLPSSSQPLKFHTKFARQNGIHVTPTTMINGLIFDSSSSWGLSEWKEVLDPLF